jgi:hypothetical protein
MALFLGAEFRWLKRKLYREQRRFSSPQLVAAERSEVALRWTPETGPENKVELNPYLLGGDHGQKAEAA